jgi:hypothetical protein
VQRCQGQSSVCAIAAFKPACASETTSRTACRPRFDQAAEEAAPERFGLALADIKADHLPVAGLVHGIGEHQRLRHDAAAVAHLLDLRIQPQVGVAALQRPAAEGLQLLIEAGADP